MKVDELDDVVEFGKRSVKPQTFLGEGGEAFQVNQTSRGLPQAPITTLQTGCWHYFGTDTPGTREGLTATSSRPDSKVGAGILVCQKKLS